MGVDDPLGTTDVIECEIPTGDITPIYQRPYPQSFGERQVVRQEVNKIQEVNKMLAAKSCWSKRKMGVHVSASIIAK